MPLTPVTCHLCPYHFATVPAVAHNQGMTPRELADQICRVLHEAGHQAYLVGGCVRDLVLGREPEDYDVATDAAPERIQALFPGSLGVGARFGVILVQAGEAEVEAATFRSDVGYTDGRHPDRVEFARSPEEDVRRRDFTINGLLMDIQTGQVLDFVEGQADLKACLIRAIGAPDERFKEDKLRMLRAVRFAARFGYQIEPQTFAAIAKLHSEITQISAERIRDEILKILTEGAARRGFELLEETGLLAVLLPEVAKLKGCQQPAEFHPEGDVWIHTLLMLNMLDHPTTPLALGVLLHDVGKPPTFRIADRIRFDNHTEVGAVMAEVIGRRLRLSSDEIDQVMALVRHHLRFKDVFQMRPATLKRFARMNRFEEHLELHRLDCLASHGDLSAWRFVKDFLARTPPEELRLRRLLTGDDLIALGYPPGPRFAEILDAVEDAQLDGRLTIREDAVAFVIGSYPLRA